MGAMVFFLIAVAFIAVCPQPFAKIMCQSRRALGDDKADYDTYVNLVRATSGMMFVVVLAMFVASME